MFANELVVEPSVGIVERRQILSCVALKELANRGVNINARLDSRLVRLLTLVFLSELVRDS